MSGLSDDVQMGATDFAPELWFGPSGNFLSSLASREGVGKKNTYDKAPHLLFWGRYLRVVKALQKHPISPYTLRVFWRRKDKSADHLLDPKVTDHLQFQSDRFTHLCPEDGDPRPASEEQQLAAALAYDAALMVDSGELRQKAKWGELAGLVEDIANSENTGTEKYPLKKVANHLEAFLKKHQEPHEIVRRFYRLSQIWELAYLSSNGSSKPLSPFKATIHLVSGLGRKATMPLQYIDDAAPLEIVLDALLMFDEASKPAPIRSLAESFTESWHRNVHSDSFVVFNEWQGHEHVKNIGSFVPKQKGDFHGFGIVKVEGNEKPDWEKVRWLIGFYADMVEDLSVCRLDFVDIVDDKISSMKDDTPVDLGKCLTVLSNESRSDRFAVVSMKKYVGSKIQPPATPGSQS